MAQLQRLAIAPSQLQNQQIFLTHEQQHYLSRVLRLKLGDRFIALDGQGRSWLAELTDLKSSSSYLDSQSSNAGWQAQILEAIAVATELPIPVTLVVALPKGSGFDDVVRQVTELGVGCIAPVISDRTLLNPSPQKLERWRRIAQEAAEQSEREIVPTVLDPVTFKAHLESVARSHSSSDAANSSVHYLCAARGKSPHLLTCLQRQLTHSATIEKVFQPTAISLAIGPEGGWTEAEIEQAIAVGYQPVSLGRRVLRAITAPVAALSLVAAALESTVSPPSP